MFAIIRHEKHHTLGTISAAASHTMRTRDTPNADPAGPAPEVWIGSQDPAADVRQLLPAKRRKNAVLSIEYLITASPDFFKEQAEPVWREYLQDQLDMLAGYYGRQNIASAVLHLDEKTPHLAVQIVPLVDGKLNARALIGSREACRIIQDLAGDVGGRYGLMRGKAGSTAKHTEVRQWYSELEPRIERAKKTIEDLEQKELELDAREKMLKRRAQAIQEASDALARERQRIQDLAASLTPIEEERAAESLKRIESERAKQGGEKRPIDSQSSEAPDQKSAPSSSFGKRHRQPT